MVNDEVLIPRSEVQNKMNVNFKTLAFITKVSMAINLVIFGYLSMTFLPKPPGYGRLRVFQGGTARLFSPHGDTAVNRREQSTDCHKSIVLFGIREFWFTFCSYEKFSRYQYLVGFPRTFFCPEVKCWVTMNHTRQPSGIRDYDIVVFTEVDTWMTADTWDWIHGNRTSGQRWVMVTEESPWYTPGIQPPKKYSAISYDWIGSYNGNSEFVQAYGYYKPFPEGYPAIDIDRKRILSNKTPTKLVAWLGSHCKTLQWDRHRFVNDFSELLHVDKYGKCGDDRIKVPWNTDGVVDELLSPYMFYLSLENSCCSGYITEKFWRSLQLRVIPIVVGPPLEDYEKLAPPHSFIHPDQFKSMVAMVAHIIEVATNEEKYLEYFRWHTRGDLVVYTQEEYYVHPLKNQSNCEIVGKYLNTPPDAGGGKIDYFGPRWFGSCISCSRRDWLQKRYMHPSNHTLGGTIWD